MKIISISTICAVFILLTTCSDGLLDISPVLDNRWDPENPAYTGLPAIPADGLIAEYLFNGNANDTSGNGKHCTGTEGAYMTDRLGNLNSAISFDGTDDYLVVADTDIGKFIVNGSSTVSFWFKSAIGNGTIFGHSTYYNDYGWKLCTASNGDDLEFSDDEYSTEVDFGSYDDVTDGNWHHIILMNTGFVITFYIDGSIENVSYDTNDIAYGAADTLYFFIGARYTNRDYDADVLGRFFTGVMDDIRVYNRNLTEDEMLALLLEGNAE